MLRTMLPDLTIEIEDMVAEGDKVVIRYAGVATDTEGFMDQPPTGKVTRTAAIQIVRIAGGQIAESWAVRDGLSLQQQFGIVAAPGRSES
jgi:predicted ester cyclase